MNALLVTKLPILTFVQAFSPSATQFLFDNFFTECCIKPNFITNHNFTQTPWAVFKFDKIFLRLTDMVFKVLFGNLIEVPTEILALSAMNARDVNNYVSFYKWELPQFLYFTLST